MVPLDELAVVGAGDPAPQRKEAFSDGGVPFVRVQDMGKLTAKTLTKTRDRVDPDWSPGLTLFPQGTVLITKSGASTLLNQRAILGQDSYVVSHIATVAPSDVTSSEWLYYFLKTVDAGRLAHGGNMPSLPLSRIKKIAVPLAPAYEQRRIVEKIETLFAEVDKGEESLRQVQALLARYRQSVLKAAVTGELTADWRAQRAGQLEHGRDLLARILKARRENWQGRGKYKEPIEPDTTNLPELPEGWVWATIDQLLLHLTSGSRDWKQFYGRGNGVFIMAQNVRPMRFDLSERFSVDPPQSNPDAMRSEVRKDDLLVTIVGANTGDVCRFPLDATEHYVCQSVALLRMADTRLARFLEMYLSGLGGGREQIESFIYGAGRPHLSFEQLRGIHVALPPLGEQTEIERRVAKAFDQIERIQQACNQELARSAALRQSILKRAFSGTLVPQDPNDEPASELLARIRAQRAAQPGKTTRRKTAA